MRHQGTGAEASGRTLSPWGRLATEYGGHAATTYVRTPAIQHHEVWISPERVVWHWVEIFSWGDPTYRSRRPPGPLDGHCLKGALRKVALRLLTLVDYVLGTLHVWMREGANDFTLTGGGNIIPCGMAKFASGCACAPLTRRCIGTTCRRTSPV